jgi:ferredoxin
VDPATLATTAPGVYAGGDAAFGPRIAIQAVADGKLAAASIHAYLRGSTTPAPPVEVLIESLPGYRRVLDYEGVARQRPPSLPIERRVGIAEVEHCFTEAAARLEASRCLHCWVNTVFHEDPEQGTECILCGACADVCPEDCISFVPLAQLTVDPTLRDLVRAECGENAAAVLEKEGGSGTALIKDETICIRCGLCAERCPAGTITMEQFRLLEPVDD